MKESIPRIDMEKKIYEKLEHIDRDIEGLMSVNYSLISMLVPTAKPTKKEIEAIGSKEKFIPLEKLLKRLRNV